MPLIFTWLNGISDGLLLSGIMVGTWEFGEFLCPWLGRWGTGLAAVIAPWGLTVAGFSHMAVPWDVYALGITAVWLWEPWDIAAEATASSILSWEAYRWIFGANVPALLGAAMLLVLAVLAVPLQRWQTTASLRLLGIMFSLDFAVGFWLEVAYSDFDYKSDLVRFSVLGIFIGIYSLFRNRRSVAQKSLKLKATRDALTEALNRHGLEQWLKQHKEGRAGAVFVLDLDDFKLFNDTWGHAIGDAVLKTATQRIQTVSRHEDALVRPGGDEFILWAGDISEDSAREMAARIHKAVTGEPIQLPQGSWPLQMSLGWAYGTLNEVTAELADQALLTAKRRGKNQIASAGDPAELERQTNRSPHWWLHQFAHSLWNSWDTAAALTDSAGRIMATNPSFRDLNQIQELVIGNQLDLHPGGQDEVERGKPWSQILHREWHDGHDWWAVQDIYPIATESKQIEGYWTRIVPLPQGTSSRIHGLDQITITTVFQPIVELQTGKVIGFEALSRPRIGDTPLSPENLFSMAEDIHQIANVDRRCLEALATQLRELEPWPNHVKLFVNVRSETLIETPAWHFLVESIERVLSNEQVIWELSELSSPYYHGELVTAMTANFLNLNWAIDDWGSGWHPLKIYQELKPGWIKVDRNWVQSAMKDEPTLKLLLELIKWAREQGISTVAEGVETAAEAEQVAEWGFVAGQGYFWGHPQPLYQGRYER